MFFSSIVFINNCIYFNCLFSLWKEETHVSHHNRGVQAWKYYFALSLPSQNKKLFSKKLPKLYFINQSLSFFEITINLYPKLTIYKH